MSQTKTKRAFMFKIKLKLKQSEDELNQLINPSTLPDVTVTIPCAGACLLDLVALRRLHSLLCRLLRRRAWLDPLDDHCRAVLPGPQVCPHHLTDASPAQAGGYVGGRPHQLVCKLSGGYRLPNHAGGVVVWSDFLKAVFIAQTKCPAKKRGGVFFEKYVIQKCAFISKCTHLCEYLARPHNT